MKLSGKISKTVAIAVTGAIFSAVMQSPALASEGEVSTSELEFIVTADEDFFEIDEGQEFETSDEYFEEEYGVTTEEYFQLEEDGELPSTLGVGTGTTQHGTLRINSDCTFATVDYYRSGSSSISVSFRVRYNSGSYATKWSPSGSMTTRGGHTFRHLTNVGSVVGVRGEMRTGGSTYITSWATRC